MSVDWSYIMKGRHQGVSIQFTIACYIALDWKRGSDLDPFRREYSEW